MQLVYRCDECNKEFSEPAECKNHEALHSKSFQIKDGDVLAVYEDGKPFKFSILKNVNNTESTSSALVLISAEDEDPLLGTINFCRVNIEGWKHSMLHAPETFKVLSEEEKILALRAYDSVLAKSRPYAELLGFHGSISDETKDIVKLALEEKLHQVEQTISSSLSGGVSEKVFGDVKQQIEKALQEVANA